MCRNFPACSVIARTTSGCEWPVELTAMPAAQSRKTLPSTSSTVAPDPRSMTSGYPRVYDGETTVLSRSMRALAFGPGSGVLICGAFSIGLTATLKGSPCFRFQTLDFLLLTSYFLLSLPPCAAGAVFEKHTPCRQIVANAIGRREVAP